jgi:hypothetical protein
MALRATVREGRLLVDEPTDLPEGTVLDLVIDDDGDDLDTAEHAAIRAAITQSLEQADQGKVAPVDAILAELRTRRRG